MVKIGRSGGFLSILTRLVFWYCLVTIIFRCPSSLSSLKDDHPQLCRPYLQARTVLEPQVRPYLEPVYNSYVAPYVERARPYTTKAYSRVYVPVSNIGRNVYLRHVEPVVTKVTAKGQEQWQLWIQPQISDLYARGEEQYQQRIEPTILELTKLYRPWWRWTKKTAEQQYHTVLIPTYKKSLPYLRRSALRARDFAVNYAIPTAQRGLRTATTFVRRHIWPTIRIAWGQHVEPQISKVQAKIASYADGRKIEAAAADIDEIQITSTHGLLSSLSSSASSFMSSLSLTLTASSSVSSTTLAEDITAEDTISTVPAATAESLTSSTTEATTTVASVETTTMPTTSTQVAQDRSPVDDIRKWEVRFKRAADQAARDLRNRVSDIISRQISGQAKGVGQALVTRLEVEADEALDNVKASIKNAVSQLSEDSSQDLRAEALHDVLETLRHSGKKLKDRAQQVREWRAQHDLDIDALISTATTSTLDVLDGIRDLGLQKIGMQWAENEDVSYNDWTEYHSLKQKFDDLRAGVAAHASQHDELELAKNEANTVQEAAMTIAENIAKELARLKDVARWKIEENDASDDFSSRSTPISAAREFGHKIAGVFSGAEDAVTEASSGVASTLSSIVEPVTASATETVAQATESLGARVEDQTESETEPVVHAVSAATNSAASVLGEAQDTILDVVVKVEAPFTDEPASDSPTTGVSAESEVEAASPLSATQETDLSLTTEEMDVGPSTTSILVDTSGYDSPVQTAPMSDIIESGSSLNEAEEVPEEIQQDLQSSIAPSAQSAVTSVASIASEYGHSMSATVLPTMAGVKDDIVDGAYQSSSSLQSMLSQAGESYADMTSELASAAKASASSIRP